MSFKTIHRSEADRFFIEALFEKTKSSFSSSTGWFHRQSGSLQTYLIDQAAYALLLMRTHLMDPMLEGQCIIDQLLHFQVESGFFPISPYAYPKICNKEHNMELALTLLFIHIHYGPLLQGDLKERIGLAIEKVIVALNSLDFGPYKAAKREILKRLYYGERIEKELFEAFPRGSREKQGVMLDWLITAASMDGGLKPFLESVARPEYIAPLLEECYDGKDPLPSFFELGAAYLFKKELPDLPFLIQAARYRVEDLVLDRSVGCVDIEHGEQIWHFDPAIGVWVDRFDDKGFPTCHLWKIALASGFCIAQPTGYLTTIHPIENGLKMVIDVKEDEAKSDFFHIYLPRQDQYPPTVDGIRSNTWQWGERVVFQNRQGGGIAFHVRLIAGECTAFGHLSLGYREGQQKRGSLLDPAADWIFSLRPIRCQACKIEVNVTLWSESP